MLVSHKPGYREVLQQYTRAHRYTGSSPHTMPWALGPGQPHVICEAITGQPHVAITGQPHVSCEAITGT